VVRALADRAGCRLALLLATSAYSDPDLSQLRAPGRDAHQLAQVLGDPRIGGYEVQVELNAVSSELHEKVEDFCADRHPDDQLLIYLSCHGVLDVKGRLYYAAANTSRRRLAATAVAATWLSERLEDCRARSQVLILDCCHSGAFVRGAKGDADLALQQRFEPQGRGRIVLTASRATEYSFEGGHASGEGLRSVFTHAIVEGLRTGEADRDRDGLITVTDLYGYVYDRVRAAEPRQTPELWTYGAEGDLLIAYSVRRQLPEDLRITVESPRHRIRATGVGELAELLDAVEADLALTARQTLLKIAKADIPAVAELARVALAAPAGTAADQVRQVLAERAQAEDQVRQEAKRQGRLQWDHTRDGAKTSAPEAYPDDEQRQESSEHKTAMTGHGTEGPSPPASAAALTTPETMSPSVDAGSRAGASRGNETSFSNVVGIASQVTVGNSASAGEAGYRGRTRGPRAGFPRQGSGRTIGVGFRSRSRAMQPRHKRDGIGLLCLGIAIALAIGVWWRPGGVGRATYNVVSGSFGSLAWTVPLLVALLGWRFLRHPDRNSETARAAIGWTALLIGALGLIHIARGTPKPSDGAAAIRAAGGIIGYAASGPLAAVLTPWLATPLLALVAMFGVLVISGTPVHRIPERLTELKGAFAQRERPDDANEDEEGQPPESHVRGEIARAARLRPPTMEAGKHGEHLKPYNTPVLGDGTKQPPQHLPLVRTSQKHPPTLRSVPLILGTRKDPTRT